jgi:hypothetical protein
MIWIRRVLAAPLILVSLICAIGAGKNFAGRLPDSSTGMAVMSVLFAAATGAGAYFLLRPDVRKLGGLTSPQVRKWFFTNPLGQAVLFYAAAVPIMAATREAAVLPGLVAQCAYTVLSTRAAGNARRFWPTAILALLGFIVLMGALAGTAEVLHPRGFGEGGMLFLLPMYGFPILLAVFGIARALRKSKAPSPSPSPPVGGPNQRP